MLNLTNPELGIRNSRFENSAGFTLVETLLVVLVLLLVAAACVGTFTGTFEAASVSDSADRMEALIHSCRAEAARTGRRVQLSPDAVGQVQVGIENDPLGSPNIFAPLDAWWVSQSQLPSQVQWTTCELTGPSASLQAAMAASVQSAVTDEPAMLPINFLPDGSSDCARLVIQRQDGTWQVELLLNGFDGSVTRAESTGEEQ